MPLRGTTPPRGSRSHEHGAAPRCDWRATVDEDSGRSYYFHVRTNKVQWRRPPEFIANPPDDDVTLNGIDYGGGSGRNLSWAINIRRPEEPDKTIGPVTVRGLVEMMLDGATHKKAKGCMAKCTQFMNTGFTTEMPDITPGNWEQWKHVEVRDFDDKMNEYVALGELVDLGHKDDLFGESEVAVPSLVELKKMADENTYERSSEFRLLPDNPEGLFTDKLAMAIADRRLRDSGLYPVFINVYSVGHMAALKKINTGQLGLGAYHTGLELYNTEISFGFNDEDRSGVFACAPKRCGAHSYLYTIHIGDMALSVAEVQQRLEEVRKQEHKQVDPLSGDTKYKKVYDMYGQIEQQSEMGWWGDEYDIINNNCNFFCDYMCKFVVRKPLPREIYRLAAWIHNVHHGTIHCARRLTNMGACVNQYLPLIKCAHLITKMQDGVWHCVFTACAKCCKCCSTWELREFSMSAQDLDDAEYDPVAGFLYLGHYLSWLLANVVQMAVPIFMLLYVGQYDEDFYCLDKKANLTNVVEAERLKQESIKDLMMLQHSLHAAAGLMLTCVVLVFFFPMLTILPCPCADGDTEAGPDFTRTGLVGPRRAAVEYLRGNPMITPKRLFEECASPHFGCQCFAFLLLLLMLGLATWLTVAQAWLGKDFYLSWTVCKGGDSITGEGHEWFERCESVLWGLWTQPLWGPILRSFVRRGVGRYSGFKRLEEIAEDAGAARQKPKDAMKSAMVSAVVGMELGMSSPPKLQPSSSRPGPEGTPPGGGSPQGEPLVARQAPVLYAPYGRATAHSPQHARQQP